MIDEQNLRLPFRSGGDTLVEDDVLTEHQPSRWRFPARCRGGMTALLTPMRCCAIAGLVNPMTKISGASATAHSRSRMIAIVETSRKTDRRTDQRPVRTICNDPSAKETPSRLPSTWRTGARMPLVSGECGSLGKRACISNRPLLDLRPYAPKANPVVERGIGAVSSSSRAVAWAPEPVRVRNGECRKKAGPSASIFQAECGCVHS